MTSSSSTQEIQDLTHDVKVFKSKYGSECYKHRDTSTQLEFAHKTAVNMFLKMGNEVLLREYAVNSHLHVYGDDPNKKTDIREYTNKAGKSHLAHFFYTKYLGSCSKMGTTPIVLKSWFNLGDGQFRVNTSGTWLSGENQSVFIRC
mgnify:CR=1 FL=1